VSATPATRLKPYCSRGGVYAFPRRVLWRGAKLKPRTVFIDVDDTLIRSAGTKAVPAPSVIECVRRLKGDGAALYLWSSGGAEYCAEEAERLGITDCFVGFLTKPNAYIDDQPVQEWRYCTHVYTTQLGRLES
jgi:hypothetical protein